MRSQSSSFAKSTSQTLLGRRTSQKKIVKSKPATKRSSIPIEPFRDVSNSPVRTSYVSKTMSNNCLDLAQDLLKAASPKIIGGSFTLEQGVIKAELVSILSDLKDAEESQSCEHRSSSLGMLKNEPIILCNKKSRQEKNQKSLTWDRKDSNLVTTKTAMAKSTSSMRRLP